MAEMMSLEELRIVEMTYEGEAEDPYLNRVFETARAAHDHKRHVGVLNEEIKRIEEENEKLREQLETERQESVRLNESCEQKRQLVMRLEEQLRTARGKERERCIKALERLKQREIDYFSALGSAGCPEYMVSDCIEKLRALGDAE